jgi:hypothetical protein
VRRTACARALLATLLLGAAVGCSRTVKGPPAPLADAEEVLAALRARTESVRSFHATGTVYLRTDREKHFLHFEAWFERPSRMRLAIDVPGFLGLGSGRLLVVRRADRIEALRPGSEVVERASLADDGGAPIAVLGLNPADAPYLVAPHAGPEDHFRRANLVSLSAAGTGGLLRVVLDREDRLREVLEVMPPSFAVHARRVVEPGGRVLFASTYRYGEEDHAYAREVETFLPEENMRLTTRFRTLKENPSLPDSLFRLAEN